MALKLKYESKEDIPEELREHYVEKDDAFVLDAEGLRTDDDVSEVKEALRKERNARRDAERKHKELQDDLPEDFSIEEWNRLKDSGQGDVEERLKDQRERLQTQHQKQLEKVQGELDSQKGNVHRLLARDGLHKAMSEANISEPLRPAVEAMFLPKVQIEGDGDDMAALLDEQPLSEAIKQFAQSDQGKYFVAAPANGGGGSNGARGNGSATKKLSEMSGEERIALKRDNPEQFRQMRNSENLGDRL